MPIYATPADLWAYMGKAGDPDAGFIEQTTPLLRRASSLVQHAIRGAIYRVNVTTGFPLDLVKATGVLEATCEQAMSWQLAGIDPYTHSVTPKQNVAQKSLGSASVSYEANGEAQARANALASGDELTGEAWRILDAASLLSTNVQHARPDYSMRVAPLDYTVVTGTQIVGE